MSDIKLFRIAQSIATEILGTASHLEKPLQILIEGNLEPLLGIRFVATEYPTGKTHSGRIDTLGLDENNSPVIVEYKRDSHENIINQGLFYLDWLMDHKAEFKLLVLERFGKPAADCIDWSAPRLLCIASDFTKYDSHAVQQMNHNIELIRYRKFGNEMLLLELVNAVSQNAKKPIPVIDKNATSKATGADKTIADWLAGMPPLWQQIFDSMEEYVTSLGDDVQRKDWKFYIAFKRLRNFATVCFQKSCILLYLHVDPAQVSVNDGFTRDISNVNHWGTGNLEVTIRTDADFQNAKPLLLQAYEGGSQAGVI